MHVALEIPLRGLALGRFLQRHDARDARVEVFAHPLDRTALASGVAAFEDHGDALAGVADPGVELHQLDLERRKLVLVVVFVHPGVVGIGGIEDGVLLRRADGLAHAFGGLLLEESG
jgi:hypothetical protein